MKEYDIWTILTFKTFCCAVQMEKHIGNLKQTLGATLMCNVLSKFSVAQSTKV